MRIFYSDVGTIHRLEISSNSLEEDKILAKWYKQIIKQFNNVDFGVQK